MTHSSGSPKNSCLALASHELNTDNISHQFRIWTCFKQERFALLFSLENIISSSIKLQFRKCTLLQFAKELALFDHRFWTCILQLLLRFTWPSLLFAAVKRRRLISWRMRSRKSFPVMLPCQTLYIPRFSQSSMSFNPRSAWSALCPTRHVSLGHYKPWDHFCSQMDTSC